MNYLMTVRRWFVGLLLVSSLWAGAADVKDDGVLLQLHFAGADALKGRAEGRSFVDILGLPETAALGDMVAAKLARQFSQLIVPAGEKATEAARLLQPLLIDLGQSESRLEIAGAIPARPSITLAVRATARNSNLWRTNTEKLRAILSPDSYNFQSHLTNQWFVLRATPPGKSLIQTTDPGHSSLLDQIRDGRSPDALNALEFCRLEADLPRLAQWLLKTNRFPLPRAQFTLLGRGPNVRTQGRLTFDRPQNWKLERWTVPTNTIADPQESLISFTAVQGFGPWLSEQKAFQQIGLPTVPNQIFTWGQTYVPYQLNVAFASGNSTRFFEQLKSKTVPLVSSNLSENAVGYLMVLTNHIVWRGLPIIVPFLRQAPDKDFAVAGIFPVAQPTNPPPAELIGQLTSRTNLLYYSWEITQERLMQLLEAARLLSVVVTVPEMGTNSVVFKWLEAIQPRLGNSATEISVSSPTELVFTRTSPFLLTGFETLAAAYWMEGTSFPRADLEFGFRTSPLPKSRKDK